ncbi:MAG TPA: O-antigen ligase family protein [Bryobacteraceae bacterium]|nr:O-antigen ligase family protein [Bryobacteraceae bacterium]
MQKKAAGAAFYLSWASAVAVLVSIAASQILLALAVATLLISGLRLRLPRIWWLLAAFLGGTLISLAFSPDPAAGTPQVRKFFVYLVLLVVFSTFRNVRQARWLVLSWAAVAAAGSGVALAQFGAKVFEAARQGVDFYQYYVADRITGFMSHWMTFSGEAMIALVLLTSFLVFGRPDRRLRIAGSAAWVLLSLALVLGFTRAAWVGAAAGIVYLFWYGKRRLLWALPVAAFAMLLVPGVRSRAFSTFRPHGQLDSNQHRIVCWRTGIEMIEANPVVGLGPEMVQPRFNDYVPADIPRPLPEGWYGHLHNIYLHYAAERGIPTALALTAMLIVMLRDFRRAAVRLGAGPAERDARFLLHGAAATVIAVMFSGLFEHNLGDSEVLAMFLATAAAGYVARESAGAASPETLAVQQEDRGNGALRAPTVTPQPK